MVKQYGDRTEPGVVSTTESDLSVSIRGDAPADPALVGPADLDDGDADPGEVKVVTRPSQARQFFGNEETSPLTGNIIDAMFEGASPVYAAAVDTNAENETVAAGEGILAEAPLVEGETIVNGGAGEAVYALGEPLPEAADVGDEEVYLDPATGDFVAGASVTEIDYVWQDYENALREMSEDGSGEIIDMLGVLTENVDVQTEAQFRLGQMANEYNFAVGFFPAETYIPSKIDYTPAFDNSRIQLIYPGRDEDGNHVIGAYVGLRASIGIRTTPIRRRLSSKRILAERLDRDERGALIDNFVVPIQSSMTGAQVMDDINTVNPVENAEEKNYRFAYTRLVLDYITKTIQINEEGFIGRLNRPAIRNALQAAITSSLQELKENAQVIDFSVYVEAQDATTADVEISLHLAQPMRYIENTITVGE